jgi:hypothetical protein
MALKTSNLKYNSTDLQKKDVLLPSLDISGSGFLVFCLLWRNMCLKFGDKEGTLNDSSCQTLAFNHTFGVETSGEKIACQGLIIKQHAYLGLKLHTA